MTQQPTTAMQIFGELRQMAWVVPKGTFDNHLDHWINSLGVGRGSSLNDHLSST